MVRLRGIISSVYILKHPVERVCVALLEPEHIFLALLEPCIFGLVEKVCADTQDGVMCIELYLLRSKIESHIRVPGGIEQTME